MIPGGNIYYTCPICKNIISKGTLISGNTFGAKHYSDHKTIADMLPQYPEITKCKKCHNIFWLDEELLISEPLAQCSLQLHRTIKNRNHE